MRRLTVIAAVCGLVGVAALATLVTIGWLTATDSVTLGLCGMAVGALGVVVVGVRRTHHGVQTVLREGRARGDLVRRQILDADTRSVALLKDVRAALGEDRVEIRTRLARTAERLEELPQTIGRLEEYARQVADLEGAVGDLQTSIADSSDQILKSLRESVAASKAQQARLHDRLYAKLEAQTDLRHMLKPRAPMPLMGGWALDADVMHLIVRTLWTFRPELIVECGSGTSSVWLGYLVEQLGTGRVVALEHDERYADASRDQIRAHLLDEVVEIRHAPLQAWSNGEEEQQWYAPAMLDSLKGIGVLLVDGPPGATGSQARYPAAPMLLPRCTEDVVIVLDDASRPDERIVSDRWLASWPELERIKVAGGSAHIFRRRQGPLPTGTEHD